METRVTVVIPSIPPRGRTILPRALDSVLRQERPADAISIAIDHGHQGAAITRNRALAGVTTEWTAFLDDDDTLRPGHIGSLLRAAQESGADVIYPWFTVVSGWDPLAEFEGQPFNEKIMRESQNFVPVTVLARTELVQSVGGFEDRNKSTEPGASPCDEWGLWLKLLDAGAKFYHLNERTWYWHWGVNTSGRGDVW
jgi:glycosyltransferase involved in cell wall biosynthesis